MSNHIDTLAAMMDTTSRLMRSVSADDLDASTPCSDYTVGQLLEHLATWIQVFDSAVNDTPLPFDPTSHRIESGWADVYERSAESIVNGLRDRGVDRPMTMTSDPIPGEFVMNMLLMEYVGHGWDLSRATGIDHPYTEQHAATALDAARSIIRPEYRGTGMFEGEVTVADDADHMTKFIAFTGRDPEWARPQG